VRYRQYRRDGSLDIGRQRPQLLKSATRDRLRQRAGPAENPAVLTEEKTELVGRDSIPCLCEHLELGDTENGAEVVILLGADLYAKLGEEVGAF
jgi:hypothetical protein